MENNVIVFRNNKYLGDHKDSDKNLPDVVLENPYGSKGRTLRLSNGVILVWKMAEGWDKMISASFKGIEIFSTGGADIPTVISTINSFKDNTTKEIEELLHGKFSDLVKEITKMESQKSKLENNVNKLKKIKSSLSSTCRLIDEFIQTNNDLDTSSKSVSKNLNSSIYQLTKEPSEYWPPRGSRQNFLLFSRSL